MNSILKKTDDESIHFLSFEVKDGLMIISGDEEEDVAGVILSHPDIARRKLLISIVPSYSTDKPQGEE